jgi:hypothetical protein
MSTFGYINLLRTRNFYYSNEADFFQKLLRGNNKKTIHVIQPYIYIDDVLSINNNNFYNHVQLIYPNELEIKDT